MGVSRRVKASGGSYRFYGEFCCIHFSSLKSTKPYPLVPWTLCSSLSGLHSWEALQTSLYSSRTILTSPATTIRRKHRKRLAVCISYLGRGTKDPKPREPRNYKSFIPLTSVDRESGSVSAEWFWFMVFPKLSVRASVGSRFA